MGEVEKRRWSPTAGDADARVGYVPVTCDSLNQHFENIAPSNHKNGLKLSTKSLRLSKGHGDLLRGQGEAHCGARSVVD